MATTIKISEEALDVLRRSTITATSVVLPPEQLSRPLYEQVNKALEAAGGKWNRKQRAHLFTADPREALGLTVATGKAVNHQQVKQSFYTPDSLADRLVANLKIEPGHVVLEPSCGTGSLIRAVLRLQPGALIDGIDTDETAIASILHDERVRVSVRDFLSLPVPRERYHYVVMNPPFSKGQDIAHVTHALGFLRPGGTLAAITSPSWQTSTTKRARAFRAMLDQHAWWHVEDIEAGAFKESGTGIPTAMLIVTLPEG